MKKSAVNLFSFLVIAVGLCLMSLSADAQVKVVEQNEYISAYQKSLALADNLPVRREKITETFREGILVRTEIDIMLRDRSGYIQRLFIGKENGNQTESETLYIGDKIYSRENNSPWEVKDRSTMLITGTGTTSSPYSCDQMTVEEVFLDHHNAKLYHETRFVRKSDGLDLIENKTWFGLDGLLLKVEITVGKYLPRTITERVVTTFEYNPSETVTAPVK